MDIRDAFEKEQSAVMTQVKLDDQEGEAVVPADVKGSTNRRRALSFVSSSHDMRRVAKYFNYPALGVKVGVTLVVTPNWFVPVSQSGNSSATTAIVNKQLLLDGDDDCTVANRQRTSSLPSSSTYSSRPSSSLSRPGSMTPAPDIIAPSCNNNINKAKTDDMIFSTNANKQSADQVESSNKKANNNNVRRTVRFGYQID